MHEKGFDHQYILETLTEDGRPPIEATLALKEIFDPVCTDAATKVLGEIAAGHAAQVYEAAPATSTRLVFSSEEQYRDLAWDVLEPLTLEQLQQLQQEQRGWARQEAIAQLQERYLRKHPDTPWGDRFFLSYAEMMFDSNIHDQLYGANYRQEMYEGGTFDPSAWKAYEAEVAAKSVADQSNITAMHENRRQNTVMFDFYSPQLRLTPRILYVHNNQVSPESATAHLVLPVGEYGEDFALDLATTNIALEAHAERHSAAAAREVTVGNEDLLMEFTTRASRNGEATGETTMHSVLEGINTNTQVKSILTLDVVAGYEDDPHGLTRAIVKAGLVERVARYSGMGLIGPMALAGLYYPGSVIPKGDGVDLSPGYVEYLHQQRQKYVAHVIRSAGRVAGRGISRRIGRVCPVTGKDGGLQALSEAHVALESARQATR